MNNEKLLEEIRENFDIDVREWQDIRDAGREDMVMIADGPWSADERKSRKDRLCLSFDELGQYINQSIGDARQNKRAIKVTPKGNGANDKTAEKRAGMIREVEYQSSAQVAYMTGFESMLKRGYGYFKLGTKFCKPGSFDQELTIEAIPNPDTCYLDFYAKKPDWSDMGHAYEIDHFSDKEFAKKWPDAEIQSFGAAELEIAPHWIKGDRIQVAAYWKLEKKRRELLSFGNADSPIEKYRDELPGKVRVEDSSVIITIDGQTHKVPLLNHRKEDTNSVCQYITNGIEILETNPQKWVEIPIIPMFGPEEYVDNGSGSKRRLLSMVRKARDAYMSYCYVRTNEVEVIGLVPKVLYMGYEGQFATNTPWATANKVALAYGEVKAITPATGQQILPLPQRQLYDPPVEALERAAASFRLAIQSAMGIGGMLNGKVSQEQNAKSGEAIKQLDRQESQGTFVYISNYERALERAGRMLEAGLEWCYDTEREVGTRSPSDAYSSIKINQDVQGENGQIERFDTDAGDHGTTIGVGPSDQSQRDQVNEFVSVLFADPNTPPKIKALAVKLRNLGPLGDEIADAYDPADANAPDPAAAAQQIQQLTQKLQTTEQFAQGLHEQIERKDAELANKLEIAKMQEETKRVIGLATIDQQDAITKLQEELGIVHKRVDQAHELTLKAADQAHQSNEAAKARTAQETAQGRDIAAAGASQASDQVHEAGQATADRAAASESQASAQDAAAEQAALKPAA